MKKLLIVLASLAVGGVGYRLYTKNKEKGLEVPKEKDLKNNNDYVVYYDGEETIFVTGEGLFV